MIVAELALDLAHLEYALDVAVHIPGVTNTVADALSRVSSPEQARLQEIIKHARRREVPLRDDQYFLVAQLPARSRRR